MLFSFALAATIICLFLHVVPDSVLFPSLLNPFATPPEPMYTLYGYLESKIAILVFAMLTVFLFIREVKKNKGGG